MELAKFNDEILADDFLKDVMPITQLQEFELALIGGGMGDVQQ